MSPVSQVVLFVGTIVMYLAMKGRDDAPYGLWDIGPMGLMTLLQVMIFLAVLALSYRYFLSTLVALVHVH